MGGIVKTLRRSNSLSRSIFSTAGSFGYLGSFGGLKSNMGRNGDSKVSLSVP